MPKVKSFTVNFYALSRDGVDHVDSAFLSDFLAHDILKKQNQFYYEIGGIEFWKDDEIPQQAPDWCKPNVWCYHLVLQKYARIKKVDACWVSIAPLDNSGNISAFCTDIVEAKVIPYMDFATAPSWLNIKTEDDDPYVLTLCGQDKTGLYYHAHQGRVIHADKMIELLQVDGSPCGVLVHHNNYGAWVK